jgi:membrane protease YdiL (CAAX protease family)
MTRPYFENSPLWIKLALLIGITLLGLIIIPALLSGVFYLFFDFSPNDLNSVNQIIEELTQMSRNTGLSPDEAAKYGYDLLPQYITNYQNLEYAKWFLILSNQLSFLISGMVFLLILYKKPLQIISPVKANGNMYLLATALFFFVLPLVQLIGEWNRNIYIPWENLQNMLLDSEIKIGIYNSTFTDIHSVGELLLMIFFIGIVTAVAEELLFRAGLQNILLQTKMNPHVAIWLGAAIFSLIHFQFYGFFVRLLLGVLLGYLYYWSKDIRTSIIAHALNNSLMLIAAYSRGNTNEDLPAADNYFVLIAFSAMAVAVMWRINKIKPEENL